MEDSNKEHDLSLTLPESLRLGFFEERRVYRFGYSCTSRCLQLPFLFMALFKKLWLRKQLRTRKNTQSLHRNGRDKAGKREGARSCKLNTTPMCSLHFRFFHCSECFSIWHQFLSTDAALHSIGFLSTSFTRSHLR